MKQIFIVEVNTPHDQYGIEPDEIILLNPFQNDIKFKVRPVEDRVDIARIEYLLKE